MDYHQKSHLDDINYRKSGFLLAGIIAVIYTLLLIRGKHQPFVLIAALAIVLMAWFEAWPLRKAVNLLIHVGNLMNRLTNPLVFGIIYVLAVIPTSFMLKILRRDVLSLRYDSNRSTYWEVRSDGDALKNSFRNQF